MFRTKEEQDIYFDSLEQIKLYDYDYLREHEPIEINLSHEYLTNNSVNYLKFNNGYRDEVTDIIIEIDVIQTFMFDFDIKRSFIERKKCSIDEITDFTEYLTHQKSIIISDDCELKTTLTVFFAIFIFCSVMDVLMDI